MNCRCTTVQSGNEGHSCSRNATKFGLCSIHLQVEYGHFYGGHWSKRKSETCLNCGEPRSDAPVDFYCRAKPAAQSLIGDVGGGEVSSQPAVWSRMRNNTSPRSWRRLTDHLRVKCGWLCTFIRTALHNSTQSFIQLEYLCKPSQHTRALPI